MEVRLNIDFFFMTLVFMLYIYTGLYLSYRAPPAWSADEILWIPRVPGPVPRLELSRGLDRRIQGLQVLDRDGERTELRIRVDLAGSGYHDSYNLDQIFSNLKPNTRFCFIKKNILTIPTEIDN